MSSNAKPLLSICIPTYNRAELLRSALYSVVRQAAALDGQVEVVVSDNCSPDHTPEVLAWAQTLGPLRSHRNAENIGAARNYFQLVQEMAQGEYCWILGDDDLVRAGAVAEVVSALASHPDIDYAFVNVAYEEIADREPGLIENTEKYTCERRTCFVDEQRVLARWERIVAYSDHGGPFNYIGSHILRTRIWRAEKFEVETDEGFLSLEATLPHACIAAKYMTGRPVLYLGRPLVLVFLGGQEWQSFWPMVQVVRVLELGDYMAAQGAEPAMVTRYRNLVLGASSGCFWRLLRDPTVDGREHFRIGEMSRRFWKHSGFYKMLLWDPAHALLAAPLRRLRAAR